MCKFTEYLVNDEYNLSCVFRWGHTYIHTCLHIFTSFEHCTS